jgi:glyoxylase I family protein
MNDLTCPRGGFVAVPPSLSARLHHAAYVSADPERTRHFYEDVLGIPLTAFWIEREMLGGVEHVFSLASYELADGAALSFFHFADPALQRQHAAARQGLFVHLALHVDRVDQDALRRRLDAGGIAFLAFDHGYAHSLYVEDPDGQTIELCCEPDTIEVIKAEQRATAHDALQRWQAGERTVNNLLGRVV